MIYCVSDHLAVAPEVRRVPIEKLAGQGRVKTHHLAEALQDQPCELVSKMDE